MSKPRATDRPSQEEATLPSAGVPVHCSHCGSRSLVPNMIGGNGTDNTFIGLQVTCPRCGGLADMLDGTYDLRDDVFSLKAGPTESWRQLALILSDERWTRDHVERVARAVASPGHGGKPEHVAEQVRRIDPELGAWLLALLRDPAAATILALVGMVLTVATAKGAFDGDSRPEPAQIIQIIQQCQVDPEPTTGQNPSPSPTLPKRPE